MMATAGGAMLAGVAEAEPDRIWFGRGGCVEQHDDGTCAVFVRGELLGVYARDDVASRDVYIAVVMEQASRGPDKYLATIAMLSVIAKRRPAPVAPRVCPRSR